MWEGKGINVCSDLTAVKLEIDPSNGLLELEDKDLEESIKRIDRQISLIKQPLNDQKPNVTSVCNKQETVPISEKPLTVTVNKQSIYTHEDIIAKLGRKEAAALAQAILNKLLE